MKKPLFFLLAMATLLGACATTGGDPSSSLPSSSPSSDPSSSSSSSGANPYIEAGWSAEEAALLYPLLEDYVYPYYDFKAQGYDYEIGTYQESVTMTSFSLVIEDFPVEELEKYFAFMEKQEGFIDQRAAYQTPKGYYVFEKFFPESYSGIAGSFHITDPSGQFVLEGSGLFELDIHPTRVALSSWLGEEVERAAEAQLGLEMTIPEPSEKGAKYMLFLSTRGQFTVPTLAFVGKDMRESYGKDLVEAGWKNVPLEGSDPSPTDSLYYVSNDEKTGVSIYMADDSSVDVTILQFEIPMYFISYPEEKINDCLEYLYLSTHFSPLPVPDVTGARYVGLNDLTQSSGFFEFKIVGVNIKEEYEKLLLDSGNFHQVEYILDGRYVYGDKDEKIAILPDYYEDRDFTLIRVYPSQGYHAGWPTEQIMGYIGQMGGKTNIPVDNDARFVAISGDVSILSSFQVVSKQFDENMNLINTENAYKSLLNAENSGWTYDSIEEVWHDAESKISVKVNFVSTRGLVILIDKYIPSAETLSEEEVASAFKGIGVEGYSFVTVDGASGYSLVTSTEGRVYVYAWGIDGNEEIEAYKDKLVNNGHGLITIQGTYCFWDEGKKVGFEFLYDAETRRLTVDFLEFGACYNYGEANFASYNENIRKEYDPSFSLPNVPTSEGTMGLLRLSVNSEGVIIYEITVFENDVSENYGALLLENGWRQSGNDYILDGTEKEWTVSMAEYDGYMEIVVNGLPMVGDSSLPYIAS